MIYQIMHAPRNGIHTPIRGKDDRRGRRRKKEEEGKRESQPKGVSEEAERKRLYSELLEKERRDKKNKRVAGESYKVEYLYSYSYPTTTTAKTR